MLGDLIGRLRPRHCAIAAALVSEGETSIEIDPGIDPVDESTSFEIGSNTKPITGTLLAVLVGEGAVSLDSTVGDVLDEPGNAAGITLRELATHSSGLPRLAPNHSEQRVDPKNPYASYDSAALVEGLRAVDVGPRDGEAVYSNFGFQLLGHVLEVAAARPYDDLVVDRVLRPAGCLHPSCGGVDGGGARLSGYDGTAPTPWWDQPLGGAGAVALDIADFGRWLAANTFPESSPLDDAIRLAQDMHRGDRRDGRGLGWRHYNGGLIHHGGTGGFSSFGAFVPGMAGVGVLANLGGWDAIDGAAIGFLTRVVQR